MYKEIRETFLSLADEEYKNFQSSLCTNVNNIIGVRLPYLRKMAKQLAKGEWKAYINSAKDDYFEEVMLQGMVLGYVKADVDERLNYIANFIHKIDNWSVCDSFCVGLKFTKLNLERVLTFIEPYIKSKEEFEVRFGIVMLIDYYISEEYIDKVIILLNSIKHEGYYAKMGVAWAVSMCYVKFPEKTMKYLNNNSLDDFTYNKALQKIIESLKVSKEAKAIIGSMKRK
ncbi:DNA alkylation repair protein [Clostridium sp. YIM B02551]|uniref:DNA alkylation repair protein n=1 Tax=Clostridium sp. YIM B02551 TaxID=2910679 RepID=UPI001EEBCB29|nr:DNA alkylation repair protein [Clostridium sp. YIM B02551]